MKIFIFYCIWASLAIGIAVAKAGLNAESITRLLVIGLLILQLPILPHVTKFFPSWSAKLRFILLGVFLAAIVEGFHMISTPVFLMLRVTADSSIGQAINYYLIDLAFTLPAYVVIFSVIWFFISRFEYSIWEYILLMGIGQCIGDGALFFFIAAPAMLIFLPYPTTNYHAINILPYLAVRSDLGTLRRKHPARWLAPFALVLTYLFCGSLIKIFGKPLGFE